MPTEKSYEPIALAMADTYHMSPADRSMLLRIAAVGDTAEALARRWPALWGGCVAATATDPLTSTLADGMASGYTDGYADGYRVGYADGYGRRPPS